MHRSIWLLAAVLGATSVYLVAPASGSATFSNSAPITINDSSTPPTAATPYLSQIAVFGTTGATTDVNVTLTGFNHTFPDDVDVLLVGPGGQSLLLMSDAGFDQGASNLTFTFDDEAPAFVPETDALAAGSFKPSNYPEDAGGCAEGPGSSSDPFAAPAPAGPYGSTLAGFDGTSANGTWSLYVVDDCRGDAGSISGGWSLDITTAGPDPADEITDLKAQVSGLGLAKGITTALNSKLDEATMALAAEYTPGVCDSLRAFQNQVAAQRRKKELSEAQAERLTDAANEIRDLLDC